VNATQARNPPIRIMTTVVNHIPAGDVCPIGGVRYRRLLLVRYTPGRTFTVSGIVVLLH
jgi:hypothetical protein